MTPASAMLWLVAPLVATGCRTNLPDETGNAGSAYGRSPSRRAPTITERMKDHERLGAVLRDAAVRGDLDAARATAASLAQIRVDEALDTEWNRSLAAMTAAAVAVRDSSDIDVATRRIAELARTCGDCHATSGRPPARPDAPLSLEVDSGVRGQMRSHVIGASRLWDGLVGPSDEAWKEGALRLADRSLRPEVLTPGRTPVPAVGELVESLRRIGERAESAPTVDARVDLYAEALATCATCHRWFNGGPTPSSRARGTLDASAPE